MRRHLPVALATLMLAVTAAFAQTPTPRPKDRPATGTVPTVPGVGGDAPSEELTKMGDPAGPGGPDAAHRPGRSVEPSAPPVPEPSDLDAGQAQAAIGKPALASDGGKAGTVRDFLLTAPRGPITHVVIETGQATGETTGETTGEAAGGAAGEAGPTGLRALPAGRVAGIDGNGLRLDATSAEAAQAPAFSYGPGTISLAGPR